MINSVSQTLPEQETGVGMGVFNLVATLSGAVGTALAGKILADRWLAFELFSTVSNPKGYAYSNILLLFSIVVLLGGVLYLRSFRDATIMKPVKLNVLKSKNKKWETFD